MSDLSDVRLEYVDTVEKAGRLITWLGERRPEDTLAIDLETGEFPGNPKDDSFSPWRGRVRLAQIGDGQTGWAIPWEQWRGVFEEAMNKYEGPMVLHNCAFDTRWLYLHSDVEIPWHRLHDSMIASRIISPLESAALKRLTSKYVDPRASALQSLLDDKMRDNGWTWGTVPLTLKEYWSYGALDTVLTVRMWEKLGKEVLPGGAFNEPYELEMGVRQVCTRMEMNGARIDVPYSEAQYDRLNDYAQKIREWAKTSYGINLASTKQVSEFFESTLGATFEEYTPGGAKRVDKVQLQKFVRDYAETEVAVLAQQILNMRKSEKLASSYFKNFIEMNVDGLLHPTINTLAARTSRMSIKDPALQTLHKSETIVRNAFIPRNENEVLISSDLDQVEFRMTASLANDKGLIDLFNRCDSTGGDAFTEIMREVYKDPSLGKEDKRRKLIKAYVYATLYGAGIEKMALTAGVANSEMQALSDAFNARYPRIKQFSKKMEREAAQNDRIHGQAFVMNRFGYRLPTDEGKLYTATNYIIQSTAAAQFKKNLLRISSAGLLDAMVVPVHDEIVLSVPKEDAEEAKKTIQECMTATDGWSIPLTSGADGPYERWGDAIND